MTTATYWCLATARRSWRQAAVLALLGGLLGAVALGAVAGARRTATAYGRYLAASRVSDVFVNVPGILPGMPVLRPVSLISSLPGVVSHAAYIGVYAFPVVHGHLDHSFLTDSINCSLDGEWFRQDRMTVLAGRLPRLDSTSEICSPRSWPSCSARVSAVTSRMPTAGWTQKGSPRGSHSPGPTGWQRSRKSRRPWWISPTRRKAASCLRAPPAAVAARTRPGAWLRAQ